MAGIVDEAEDAYCSGTPGLILLCTFSGSLRVDLLYVSILPYFYGPLSLHYDFVNMLVFSLFSFVTLDTASPLAFC